MVIILQEHLPIKMNMKLLYKEHEKIKITKRIDGMDDNRKYQFAGLLIILFSLLWIVRLVNLVFLYQKTEINWYYMHPNWLLLINITMGIIGVIVGFFIYFRKIKLITGFQFLVILVLALIGINQISHF